MERIDIHNATADELARAVRRAAEVLEAGGVIVYPTDTVYGLGADAINEAAVERVAMIKGREAGKPMLVMVSSVADMERYAEVTELARALVDEFLPGPLSLELKKKESAPPAPIGGTDFLSFRIPDQPFCAALSRAFKKPITSTSVNRSGHEQPRTLSAMLAQLGDAARHIDLVVDAGELPESLPSTLVSARGTQAVILREGAVSREALLAYL